MKSRKPALLSLAAGLLLGLGVSITLADDIEVYTGASLSAGARPNVVFILDTSQSMTMGENRMLKYSKYDPDVTYSGSCTKGKLYAVKAPDMDADYWTDAWRWDAGLNSDGHPDDGGCVRHFPFVKVKHFQYFNDPSGNHGYHQELPPVEPVDADLTDPDYAAKHAQYLLDKAGYDTAMSGWSPNHPDTAFCKAAVAEIRTHGYYKDYFQWYYKTWSGDTGSTWAYPGINVNKRVFNAVSGEEWKNKEPWPMVYYRCKGDGHAVPNNTSGESNQMYVFDGNYLNWYYEEREDRLTSAKRGLKKLIDALPEGINVGLMPFSEDTLGARVVIPVEHITDNKTALKAAIDALVGNIGTTPLAGSLYESYLYYAGEQPVIGGWNVPPSVPESLDPHDPAYYNSPIDLSCQTNHIVMITDGEPEADFKMDDRINALPEFGSITGGCGSGDNCSDELAKYMVSRDVNSTVASDNFVKTHAIGLDLPQSSAFFNSLVAASGGVYAAAKSADDLADSMKNIFENSIVINGTFVAPAVSVNAFNRAQHRDELYFAVFEVGETPRWNGNLKKYQIRRMADGALKVVDVNGNEALDSTSGEFSGSAKSWWSDASDGNDPVKGGANTRLQSWVTSNVSRSLWTNVAPGQYIITADNTLSSSNGHITPAMTNATDETESDSWLDAFTSGRFRSMYGAPLHSRPIVVNYGGTDASPDAVAYFTTNDGLLHALHPGNSTTADSLGGYEKFGFLPKEMLAKLGALTSNGVAAISYGLDASVVPWVNDQDADGNIETGDHVYLYFGAGRGGRFYYGLDVTSYTSPKLLWSAPITGGGAGDFAELGYTTAEPVRGRVKIGTTSYDVLFISGGYDLNEDNMPTSANDTMGRALYIVNATDGQMLWRGGPDGSGASKTFSNMKFSIPSSPRVLDMNGDGYSDRVYFGDLGGQVWRLDIDNTASSAAGLVSGDVIADLDLTAAEQSAGAHRRKFFNTPDVALVNDTTSGAYLAINIGSGNRSHPVSDKYTNDAFFSLRDRHIYDKPGSYTSSDGYGITVSDLVNVSLDASPSIPANGKGWYLKMRENEKVLAESRTFENQVMFTTYQPDASISADACKPNLGIGRVYALDVRNSSPVNDFDGDNITDETDDRDQRLARSGIPPEVVILFPSASGGRPVALVGPEIVDVKLGNTRYRTYWTDKEKEN